MGETPLPVRTYISQFLEKPYLPRTHSCWKESVTAGSISWKSEWFLLWLYLKLFPLETGTGSVVGLKIRTTLYVHASRETTAATTEKVTIVAQIEASATLSFLGL